MSTAGTLIRLLIVAIFSATILAALDVQLGIEIVDRGIDLLDIQQYL